MLEIIILILLIVIIILCNMLIDKKNTKNIKETPKQKKKLQLHCSVNKHLQRKCKWI